MNRGAAHREIFRGSADRRKFLNLIAEGVDKFGVEIHAFCLMGNHYHLLARTPEPNLDKFMHMVGFKYVRYFNDRYTLDGPLWRSRYHPLPVENEAYATTVLRYIHRNPLALGVTDLAAYPWSSYGSYQGGHKPNWLTTNAALETVGGQSAMISFIETEAEPCAAEVAIGAKNAVAIGSPQFRASIADAA